MSIAYVNGNYLPLGKASISVMDRGFMFGDAVYEVIPVYNAHPFREQQHLARFARSLNAVGIQFDVAQLSEIIHQLIKQNQFYQEQAIYIQVTRGTGLFRDLNPPNITPNIFAFIMEIPPNDMQQFSKGVAIITIPDIRWSRCDIKSIDLLPNILLRKTADNEGMFEAIMVRNGLVLEGTATNFFMVKEGALYTPPLGQFLLGGITRELVLELAAKHGIDAYQRDISEHELALADEIWITSSTKEIVPVIQLNNKPVGKGKVGTLWNTMVQYYLNYKNELMNTK